MFLVLRTHWRPTVVIAVMTLAAYSLVLSAFQIAPVSYAGAAREIGIVFGALAGWLLLGERFGGHSNRRRGPGVRRDRRAGGGPLKHAGARESASRRYRARHAHPRSHARSLADFEQLFEARGGPKSCWCMHFRRDESGRTPRAKMNRKRAMTTKIQGGTPVGLLAYDASDEPVAWCSFAPRNTLVNHGGIETPDEDPAKVWSITCFYVKSAIRRHGVMGRLIEEAVAHARRNGGSVVEAYPVAPNHPATCSAAGCLCLRLTGSWKWAGRGSGGMSCAGRCRATFKGDQRGQQA